MNARAMWMAVVIACATSAGRGIAAADRVHALHIRQINTAARVIGCSTSIPSCDSATSIRTGLVVVDVASERVRRGPVSPVAMFHGSARPHQELLGSQMIVGAGARVTVGRSWLQAGLGLAGAQLAPGPKTIATMTVLTSPAPAVMAGVATQVAVFDLPVQLSLDVGSSLGVVDDDPFGDVYQVTASVLATNL